MVIDEIQEVLGNVDPLVVLGGVGFLGGLALLYRTVTSFDRNPGMTEIPVQVPDPRVRTPADGEAAVEYPPIQALDGDGNPIVRYVPPYKRSLAVRKQKPSFYAGLLGSIVLILASGFTFGESISDARSGYL